MQFLTMKEEIKYLQLRYDIYQQLESIVRKKDFIKVEPDYFEPYERFIKMNKRIKKETMVKIFNNDGSLSILRPDVTTNIIKQVVPKWENGDQLKMFYMATTFSQQGFSQILETKQFGVEYLGNSETSDFEVIELIFSIFKSFKLKFILEIGSQKFLNALFSVLDLCETDEQFLKDIIVYKNQAELMKFINTKKISGRYQPLLQSIFTLQGKFENVINQLGQFELNDPMIQAVEELKSLKERVNDNDMSQFATVDLSLISKFDYYDGITFKGYLENLPASILNGGRYDPLTEQFGKRMPAIGFTINLSEFIKEVIAQ
jgi:ATP phosphoribosyltransferase regulatory subunit